MSAATAKTTAREGGGFTLFDTAFGFCGVAWTTRGVTAIQLPEASEDETVRRLLARTGPVAPASPRGPVADLVKAIRRHLSGAPQDFAFVPLDLEGLAPFHRRVLAAARRIPAGRTVSYGVLAGRVGRPGAGRAVGQALARNPFPIVVPCHRVLAVGRAPGGFSAHGGVATKARLLALEGVTWEPGTAARTSAARRGRRTKR